MVVLAAVDSSGLVEGFALALGVCFGVSMLTGALLIFRRFTGL